jgi:hypothetical protein
MRFQEALLGLFAAGALAMPAALFGESSSSSLAGRDTVSDIPPMDIDWSVFDSGEFEELVPVPETNASLTKRADKLDLKDSTTLTWKSGKLSPIHARSHGSIC